MGERMSDQMSAAERACEASNAEEVKESTKQANKRASKRTSEWPHSLLVGFIFFLSNVWRSSTGCAGRRPMNFADISLWKKIYVVRYRKCFEGNRQI